MNKKILTVNSCDCCIFLLDFGFDICDFIELLLNYLLPLLLESIHIDILLEVFSEQGFQKVVHL